MLQQPQKWVHDKRDLRTNDLILVIDENMPRGKMASCLHCEHLSWTNVSKLLKLK